MESFSSNQYSNKPEWYVLKDGHHVGPVTHEKVLLFFEAGEVDGGTLVWKGGNIDWLPMKELEEFNILFSQKNVLPSLPDLRDIEAKAREEIEKNYPKPNLKKANIQRSKKPESGVIEKYKNDSYSAKGRDISFESKIDSATASVFDTQPLPELPTFVLPEIPVSACQDNNVISTDQESSSMIKESEEKNNVEGELDTKIRNSQKKTSSKKGGRQLLLVMFVALTFLVPSIVYLQRTGPLTINLPTAKKHQIITLEKVINSSSVEGILLSGIIDEKNRMFLAVNSKSPIKLFGKIKSAQHQLTSLGPVAFYFKESSKNGLVEIRNPRFETETTTFPFAGRYLVDIQVEKIDKVSIFINSLKKVFLLEEIPFIKNYKVRTRYSGDILLGKGTQSDNEKLIADFLKNRNQYIEKPILHLKQQLQTLSSIGAQFKELFFNATTVKTVTQSKKLFARQFGRDLAPILQVITLSNLSEVELDRSKLTKSFKDTFDAEFERTKLISREISGLAAFVDKRFSEGGKWFSGKRIKHRSLVNQEVKKIQEQINTSLKVIEDLKERFFIKI